MKKWYVITVLLLVALLLAAAFAAVSVLWSEVALLDAQPTRESVHIREARTEVFFI